MRKIIYAMNVSLDGFIESAEGDLSWSFVDEELHQHFNDLERKIDTILYGRGIYEIMAAYWPTADENPEAQQVEIEYASIWKAKPKIVFSTTLDQVEWNSRLVRGDISTEVNQLKEQDGHYMSVGGAGLASSLMQLDLIDEYWLYIHPVILGDGKPMFARLPESIKLQLIETRLFGSGVMLLRYRKNGVGSGISPDQPHPNSS